MIITIAQTGGFAGIRQELGSLDTQHLEETRRRYLEARIRGLEQRATDPASPGADRFQYEIRIQEAGATPRTVMILDEGDAALEDLLASL